MIFDDIQSNDPRTEMEKVLLEMGIDKVVQNYDDYVDEMSTFIVNKVLSKTTIVMNYSTKNTLHALMDAETSRIICMSPWTSTIIALSEMLNTQPWFSINHGYQFQRGFLSSECWHHQYDTIENKVNKTYDELSVSRIYRFKLIQEKSAALDSLHSFISSYRLPHRKDLPLQSEIYLEKFRQAKEIYKKKITEDVKHIYPLVTDYSLLRNITLQEAAQEIFFKFKSFTHKLSDTENIRIKYTNMIRDENDIRKIYTIMKDFEKECKLYGKI